MVLAWIGLIGIVLFVLVSLAEACQKNPGLGFLLAIPIAILLVPFKLAAMMMGGRRR